MPRQMPKRFAPTTQIISQLFYLWKMIYVNGAIGAGRHFDVQLLLQ